jgi:hypothetical protein
MTAQIINEFTWPSGTQEWLDQLLESNGITHERGKPMRWDQYGTDYTILAMDGPVKEGEPLPIAREHKESIERYRKSLLDFIGTNKHVVWRIAPELDVRIGQDFSVEYRMYSRLTVYPERPKRD